MIEKSAGTTAHEWSNRQMGILKKYKERVREMEVMETAKRIISKDLNNISFYNILPKEELPKYLQKMVFQTINLKEKDLTNSVKIYRKENVKPCETKIRCDLKKKGQIMLLSQIYQYLQEPSDSQVKLYKTLRKQIEPLPTMITQLDEWEKTKSKRGSLEARLSKINSNFNIQSMDGKSHKKQFIIKKFKIGSDYSAQIQKNLQIICYTHANETNLLNKYSLIENSSKLLRKQLQEMKQIVQKQIQDKMKTLTQSRREHHQLYEQKLKLQIQGQELDQERSKEQQNPIQAVCVSYLTRMDKIQSVISNKKIQIENNDAKIFKVKKTIELLEEETLKNEEQLRNIVNAEKTYLRISLKTGIDCRDTGLGWIIKKLFIKESDLPHTDFPQYLDKKSRFYLINKTNNEQTLQKLLQNKKEFVSKIGKESKLRKSGRKSSIKLEKVTEVDQIKQIEENLQDGKIAKKYSRSARKITALREEFQKNQNLFMVREKEKGFTLSKHLDGLSGKQIYKAIGQKIKVIDFSKIKKDKIMEKSDLIFEYQNILQKVEQVHIMMEQNDIQHENHLLTHYRDNKDVFFMQAAACFGYKKAYTLIIKNFSWKSQAIPHS